MVRNSQVITVPVTDEEILEKILVFYKLYSESLADEIEESIPKKPEEISPIIEEVKRKMEEEGLDLEDAVDELEAFNGILKEDFIRRVKRILDAF